MRCLRLEPPIKSMLAADCLQMARSGLGGPSASLTTGMSFGVPPLLKFGNRELQERFLPDFLMGVKRICIAITEPDAGSDVAGIQTTAERSADGKFFTVNGTKKWSVACQAGARVPQLTIVGSRMASGLPLPQWLYGQVALARQASRSSLSLFSILLE